MIKGGIGLSKLGLPAKKHGEINQRERPLDIIKKNLLVFIDAAKPNNSSSTLFDQSGNGNNGTIIQNITYMQSEKVFRFTNGIATFNNIELRQNFSLELWFKYNIAGQGSFFGQGTSSTNSGLHVHHTSSTTIRFGMFANDLNFSVSTNTSNWFQYILAYNHSTREKSVFINGSQVASSVGNQYTGSGTFRLGATYSTGGTPTLNADISKFMIYTEVLNEEEIEQNHKVFKKRFGL